MKSRKLLAGAAIAVAALVSGCGTTSQPANPYPSSTTAATGYGVVESIQPVATKRSGPGVGAIAGGVLGGVLGNQVGSGTGRTAATAAGAIGGAVVGNRVEQSRGAQTNAYQIGVRMDNGGYATVTQENVSNLSVGNRVRIENGQVYRY